MKRAKTDNQSWHGESQRDFVSHYCSQVSSFTDNKTAFRSTRVFVDSPGLIWVRRDPPSLKALLCIIIAGVFSLISRVG